LKKSILVISATVLMAAQIFAGSNGGYAGAYTRTGLGARAIAMGNTGTAGAFGAYANYYNPALIGDIQEKTVGLAYNFMSLDRHQSYISYAMKVPPGAGFSLGWLESGVGDLQSYNSIGDQTGAINHSANMVLFSFGRTFSSKISAGVSIKILFEYINDGTDEFDYTSQGVGIDFGLLYRYDDNLQFGYLVRDMNAKLKANTDKIFERGGTTIDKFPLIQRLGVSYRTPVSWLRTAYDFEWSDKSDYKHHFGVEAVNGKNLALRAGWNDGTLTFGAGMDFGFLGTTSLLDYAFVPSVIDEGSSHLFAWQIKF
jgi:hypothetical protein